MNPPRSAPRRTAVVWGNCQAPALAALLRRPLAARHIQLIPVPPVYLLDAGAAERAHKVIARSDILITQPVRDDYRLPGLGADQIAEMLPSRARRVSIPIAFHTGAFPFQINAHGGDGERVDAPITDYHDLRLIAQAAGNGQALSVALDPAIVRTMFACATEELRKRERNLDVRISDLLEHPGAMHTISHPTNSTLAVAARRILRHLQMADEIAALPNELLGERRAPVEAAVADALGWPYAAARERWEVQGLEVDPEQIASAHLEFYARRPDVVVDSLHRYGERMALLGLSG